MERVICSVCKMRYKGKIPKGGDGSVVFPRKHYRKIPLVGPFGILPWTDKERCPGSFLPADLDAANKAGGRDGVCTRSP